MPTTTPFGPLAGATADAAKISPRFVPQPARDDPPQMLARWVGGSTGSTPELAAKHVAVLWAEWGLDVALVGDGDAWMVHGELGNADVGTETGDSPTGYRFVFGCGRGKSSLTVSLP